MPKKHDGKVVLISGGTAGIGKAASLKLLDSGYSVSAFAKNSTSCKILLKEIKGKYSASSFLISRADVTKENDVKKAVGATIKKFGRIDVLINNAGKGYFDDIEHFRKKEYEDLLMLNVVSLALLTKHAVPSMKKHGHGMIINMASISGKESGPEREFYSASKFGVMGFSEGLRKEMSPFGIKVCTVCPGMVKTGFFSQQEIARRKRGNKGKMPLMLMPEDIAEAIHFIISQPEHSEIRDITIMPFENKN